MGDMRKALVALRVAVDDADGIASDMLRPPRKRELGPVLHRRNYRDARKSIRHGIDYLLKLVGPEPNGGAEPAS